MFFLYHYYKQLTFSFFFYLTNIILLEDKFFIFIFLVFIFIRFSFDHTSNSSFNNYSSFYPELLG